MGDVVFEWVDRNIITHITAELLETVEPLRLSVERWKHVKHVRESKKLPSLDAGSLSPNEVFEIFHLNHQEDVEYESGERELFDIPLGLEATFAKYRSALETSVSSEALSRDFISLIVFNCLLEEKAAMQNAKLNPSFISTSQLLSSTIPVETSPENANSPPLEKSELCLFFETKLIKPITFNGRTYVLRSIADCSLGYSHCSTGSGNLVVVVAKRRYQMSLAYGQLLSSMGIIHEAQKREEKDRAFCFGVATDGFEYRFWAIDNKSNISSSSTYDWPKKSERQHIYSIFRAIIRTAILSSLTISPVNGQESAGDSQYPFGFGTISTRVPWQ